MRPARGYRLATNADSGKLPDALDAPGITVNTGQSRGEPVVLGVLSCPLTAATPVRIRLGSQPLGCQQLTGVRAFLWVRSLPGRVRPKRASAGAWIGRNGACPATLSGAAKRFDLIEFFVMLGDGDVEIVTTLQVHPKAI